MATLTTTNIITTTTNVVEVSAEVVQTAKELAALRKTIRSLKKQEEALRDNLLQVAGDADTVTHKGEAVFILERSEYPGINRALLEKAFPEAFEATQTIIKQTKVKTL